MQVNSYNSDVELTGSFEDWATLYRKRAVAKLAGICLGAPNVQDALFECLNADCISFVHQRKEALRCSNAYTNNKFAATLCGSIPFLRAWATRELGKDFANATLRAFGLGDADKLQEYQKSFQATHNSKAKMARSMAVTAGRLTATGLLTDTAVDVGAEAVHVQPFIGQAVSMGLGYHIMRKRMLNILDEAAKKAVTVHQNLIIPGVIRSLEYGSTITEQGSVHGYATSGTF